MNLLKDLINKSQQEQRDKALAEQTRKEQLAASATSAGNFANQGETGYGNMSGELAQDRQGLRDLAAGRNSVATEQLRQAQMQQQAAQQSMAAAASPQNAAMAARTAMTNTGRNQGVMAGQAAVAQLAERQMAQQQLAQMNLGQRGQDIEVGLGSRQNQMTGLGANKPDKPREPATWEKVAAAAGQVAPLFSDERLKSDVKSGDKAARAVLSKLAAKTYKYKDERHGKGEQFGFLAQDLEKAGAKSAIIETPIGKAIDTNKLSGINTGLIASLARRMDRMEKGRK